RRLSGARVLFLSRRGVTVLSRSRISGRVMIVWEGAVKMSRLGLRIVMDDLQKNFGSRRVLRGVHLAVEPGEFLAVVGRSGCGKSTLLRLIGGLERPTGGTLTIDGEPVNGLHPDVRIMFQDARLLPWRKVIDNVALGLPKEKREQAVSALRQVGLLDRANEWP